LGIRTGEVKAQLGWNFLNLEGFVWTEGNDKKVKGSKCQLRTVQKERLDIDVR